MESTAAPRISIIIPVYNRAALVGRALDSVFAQTYRDYEIIVVDDGSSDGSAELLESYGDRLITLRQANAGAAAARNSGIAMARGEFIAFLDSDDEWCADKLRRQLEYYDAYPEVALVYTDMVEVVDGRVESEAYLHCGAYSRVGEGQIYESLLEENFIFTPTVMVRRTVFDGVGMFDTQLAICEDRDLWLKIARQFSVGFLDLPLTIRHRHGANLTTNRELYMLSHLALFEKELAYAKSHAPRLIPLIRKKLAVRHEEAGLYYLRIAQGRNARLHLTLSRRFGPSFHRTLLLVAAWLPSGLVTLLKRLRMCFSRGLT